MRMFFALTLGVVMAASGALAKPPLREVDEIYNGLLTVALANEVRKKCDTISGRLGRGLSTLRALEARAKALGYTDEEISQFRNSDAEKARMRARGEAYLRSKGVNLNNPETFCTFGRAEIARNSQIGVLLRTR